MGLKIIGLWVGLLKKPFTKFGLLVLATIPAGVVGVALKLFVDLDEIFTEYYFLLAITFMLTAGELLFSEYFSKKKQLSNGINLKSSLYMGVGQAFGVLPGLSRSGTTITFGTLAKVEKGENANFTFLMSIPIILAAALMEVLDVIKTGENTESNGTNTADVLRRLSNLEKIIYGRE